MRKFILFLLVMISTSVSAQKWVDLNRNFNLSGKLWAYAETEDGEDIIVAKEGARWHLTNDFVAGRNHVKFWISMPDIDEDMFLTQWSADDVDVKMLVHEDQTKTYYVADEVFFNLMMVEKENGYVVRNCSVLIDQ